MNFLVFTDIHIHNFKQQSEGDERLEHTLRCLKLIYAYADSKDIWLILFVGDMFEMQKALPTIVINRITEVFIELESKYPKIKLYSISGNHDHDAMNLISKPANSSQTWLSKIFKNYHLIDNQSVDVVDIEQGGLNLIGIPYYEYGEDYLIKLKEAKEKIIVRGLNILMIHQTPKGVKNSEYYKVDTDEGEDLYKEFDLVVDGHIHLAQRLSKNFLVAGAPMQQDFGDAGTDKGFWVMDTDDIQGEHKFVSLNSKFPTFIKREEDAAPEEAEKASDYVQILPKIIGEHIEAEGIENFRADLPEEELIKNYLDEIPENDPSLEKFGVEKNEELINVGIELIN